MAAATREKMLLLILAIPSICTGLSYETLHGNSHGNDIVSFSFSDKVFDQCANRCNEKMNCVGFTYGSPSHHFKNCYLKSAVRYPPSYDASLQTAYMLPYSSCLVPVAYTESKWHRSVSGYGNARDCFNAGYCWRGGCYECAACYTLDKPWLYNVARNKLAFQSSTSSGLGASYAVDGNTDGGLFLRWDHRTCTHTAGYDQHPWWRMDLGKTYEIHSIVLFNRKDASEPDRLQKFEIRLGSSDQAQTNPLCWKQDSAVLAGSKTFKCQSGPAVGRYLSVEKDGTGLDKSRYILTLCEVVVIGALPRIESAPKVTQRTADKLTVKWDKYPYGTDKNISKYLLLVRSKETGTPRREDVSKAHTDYTLTGLSRDTEYNISVVVIMSDGTEGLPSPYTLKKTCGPPPSPDWDTDALSTSISNNKGYPSIASITVRWKLPNAEYHKCNQVASFIIKYWNDTKAKAVNTTVLRGSSSLTIHGLRPFTNYTVAVLVRDTKGYLTNLPDEKSTRTPIGRPGSLQSLENTTSNSTIHLKFKEPVDKNAEMITYIVNVSFSYKLLCGQMRAGTDIWKSMTNTDGSKLTFTKLKSYSVYNVRAWASTSAGAGPVSETLAYTKHGVPTSPPRDVKIQEQQYESLTFTWKSPDCNHQNAPGDETTYQYKLWPVNNSTEAETGWIDTGAPPLVIRHLKKETSYGFIIRVANRQGTGEAADIVIAKTEETAVVPPARATHKWLIPVIVVVILLVLAGVILAIILIWRKKKRKGREEEANNTLPIIPVQGNRKNGYDNPYQNVDPYKQVEINEAPKTKKSYKGNIVMADEISIENIEPGIDALDNDHARDQSIGPGYEEYVNLKEMTHHRPIQVKELYDYVMEKRSKVDAFEDEFKSLPKGYVHSAAICQDLKYKPKNRFKNIFPYDDQRIVLDIFDGDPLSDYINASYIRGYPDRERAYIAAQGPTKHSVGDFWRLIWQENVSCIAMITNLVEGRARKCEKYWPDLGSTATHHHITVKTSMIERFADYEVRTFEVKKGESEGRTIKQIHYTVWPDKGTPEYGNSVLSYRNKVKSYSYLPGQLLVHCSAGVGRTGTYISLDYLLDQAEAEKQVDIFNCVSALRDQRVHMVQTVEQYVLLHEMVMEAAVCGKTSVSTRDFEAKYAAWSRPKPGTGKTILMAQFDSLQSISPKATTYGCESALLKENKNKNRIKNVMPRDAYRVYLPPSGKYSSNYINAVFVNGFKKKKAYILTQAPMPSTVVDFWRMIHDHDSYSIVMLNDMKGCDETVATYWPNEDEAVKHGPFKISVVQVTQDEDGTIIRKISVKKDKSSDEKIVKQFQCNVWSKDSTCPSSESAMLRLLDKVERWQQENSDRTVTIHCMDGATRSGLFCAISCMANRLKNEQEVDVLQDVKTIRISRPQVVPDLAQYGFIFDTALEMLRSYDLYANFK